MFIIELMVSIGVPLFSSVVYSFQTVDTRRGMTLLQRDK